MNDTNLDLDSMRSRALAEMDTARRNFRLALFGASFFEAVCLTGLLVSANFHDPLHRLFVFGVGLIYMPIVLGLIALGIYVNRCTLRILARLDEPRE